MPLTLVTGAAGFIGSNLCHALCARGERVRAFDNFSTGKEENLAPLLASGALELVRGDLTDRSALAQAVRGADFVLHQAAIPSVPRSLQDPIGTSLVNAHGTLLALQAAREAGVRRFVLAGSSSAYGDREDGAPKVETMAANPLSPYAAAKLAGESQARAFHRSYGFETVVLRYFNVYGPRQDPASAYAAVVPAFIEAALAGRTATVHGDGTQSRDFCFVDNVVEANLLAREAPGAAGELINVACGESHTVLELIAHIERAVGRKLAVVHQPARRGDVLHSLADIGKARRLLGYRAAVSFAEGIARTAAWYRGRVQERSAR